MEYSGRQELAGTSGEVRNNLLLKVTLWGGLAPVQSCAHLQVHIALRSVKACERSVQMETADKKQKQSPLAPKLASTVEWERCALSLGAP